MDAKRINPILNVSDIRASFAWFEALGWEKALLQSRRPCQIDPLSQPIQPGIAQFIIAGFPRINVRANSTIPSQAVWQQGQFADCRNTASIRQVCHWFPSQYPDWRQDTN